MLFLSSLEEYLCRAEIEGHICCIGAVINTISILRASFPPATIVYNKTLIWHRAI